MKKPIYLFGAGGLGREISAMLSTSTEWQLMGFYDDNANGTTPEGDAIHGTLADLVATTTDTSVLVTIGDPETKKKVVERLRTNSRITFPTLVHPTADIYRKSTVVIGEGSIISGGVIMTTAINVGRHVLINLNCTVGHDTSVGDFTSVMPGVNLAGKVAIGKGVLIGSGAQVINNLSIADGARVGAGAVVIRDVRASTTVVGVPASEKS